MTDMGEILHKLEVEGGFSSRNLAEYANKPSAETETSAEQAESPLLEARKAYYDAYDKARETTSDHVTAMESVSAELKAYNEKQAEAAKQWQVDQAELIQSGLEAIPQDSVRNNLQTLYSESTPTLEDGSNVLLFTNMHTALTVESMLLKQPNEALQKLYDSSKEMVEQTGDLRVVGREMIGKKIGELRKDNVPMKETLDDEAEVIDVTRVGFIGNRIVDKGGPIENYVSVPSIRPVLKIQMPTSPSTP